MKLSVIISTYNQPEWLAKVLHGYLYQTFTDFEILIADDGSDDRTREVIEDYRKRARFLIKHVWHEDEGFRKCKILNKATLEAEAEYLVFTDGDCIPHRDFLATHARFAEAGRFLSGGYCKLPMGLSKEISNEDIASGRAFSLSWMRRHGMRGFSQSIKLGAGPRQAVLLDWLVPTKASWNGHGSSTWKKHVLEVNGHNEEMKYGGEDREFGERLMNLGLTGKRIRYRAVLIHLDHARGYVNQEDLARNKALREKVTSTEEIWCRHGIVKEAAPFQPPTSQNLLIRIGKGAEHFVREMRPWLLPRYRRAYAELLARGYHPPADGQPLVCCDLAHRAIDSVGGRYYFSLVRDLIDAGFHVVFTARRMTLSTFGVYWMKKLLLREDFGVIRSLDELKEPYWLITDRNETAPRNARKVVRVNYEWRLCRTEHEMAFPFFVHPQIAAKVRLPLDYKVEEPRPARIFFGGNTEQRKYDKDVISEIYHMLSRREMLAESIAAMRPEMIHRPKDASTWLSSPEFHPFVLCETQHCKIPQERWLEALAKADFFLACPGVDMPLCHNLIEALAAGAVPILQYGAYLPPPLEDGVNCLAFSDAAGLRKVIARALAMNSEEIRCLRINVRKYYDGFLAPGRFAQRLCSGPQNRLILLLNDYRVPRD